MLIHVEVVYRSRQNFNIHPIYLIQQTLLVLRYQKMGIRGIISHPMVENTCKTILNKSKLTSTEELAVDIVCVFGADSRDRTKAALLLSELYKRHPDKYHPGSYVSDFNPELHDLIFNLTTAVHEKIHMTKEVMAKAVTALVNEAARSVSDAENNDKKNKAPHYPATHTRLRS